MVPSTTPFPVNMDYSQWYWDPSTFTWLPSAPTTSPYYSDPCYSNNTSTSPNYSYPTAATDYTLDPYSHMNHGSYDSYVNNYSSNYIPGYASTNTPTHSQPTQSPAPAQPVVPAPCSPPAPAGYINYHSRNYISGYDPSNTPTYSPPMLSPVAAPPTVPAPPAAPAPSLPAINPKAKVAHKCGNCGTTESCWWRNVNSKDNLRCNTCYKYRLRNKKERPADVIQVCELIKMMKK